MLYQNTMLDIITKFPFEKRTEKLKLDSVEMNFNNNDILVNNFLIIPLIQTATELTSQAPKILYIKKANSAFNMRIGGHIALVTTLRNKNLNLFLKKFIATSLPYYKKDDKLSVSHKKNFLIFTMGIDKLKNLPELYYSLNNHAKDGFRLEIKIRSHSNEKANLVRIYMLSSLLANSIIN